jgi:RNA polymerase sigma factor (sigma-70 family)
MDERTDSDLLQQYAEHQSEAAFSELVRRQVNFVYSVAMRYVGNPPDAQDVAQTVFVILAKKAGALCNRTTLTGWLHETTRLTSRQFLRTKARRLAREQEAYMQSKLDESRDDQLWHQMAPHLEQAMSRLRVADRELLALRFIENKSGEEAAALLGIGASAAHKRTGRALESLQKFFAQRGVTSTTAAISGALSANFMLVAPAGLAKTISEAAILQGAAASSSTLTLTKGALKIMAWTKMNAAITTGIVVLLLAGTSTLVVEKLGPPSVDESLWEVNEANIAKAPPVLIIRPTRYRNRSGSVDDASNRLIGLNFPISALFVHGYEPGFGVARMIIPEDVRHNHYDLMLTLVSHQSEALRNKIKSQLGLVARHEMIETNVLWLEAEDPHAFQSHATTGGTSFFNITSEFNVSRLVITNLPISALAHEVEDFLRVPTMAQMDLAGKNIDLELQWNVMDPRHESLKKALRDQLGLALVPGRQSIDMLVVEKAK